MKSYRKELWFEVPTRRDFVNITPDVEECLRESGIKEGLVLCNAMHITASVFINDAESGLLHDFEAWLEGLAPHEPISRYRHNRTGEDNGDAHLKRTVMGREVVVAKKEVDESGNVEKKRAVHQWVVLVAFSGVQIPGVERVQALIVAHCPQTQIVETGK